MPSKIFYSFISAEILRIGRTSSSAADFVPRSRIILDRMSKQGSDKARILKSLVKMFNNHTVSASDTNHRGDASKFSLVHRGHTSTYPTRFLIQKSVSIKTSFCEIDNYSGRLVIPTFTGNGQRFVISRFRYKDERLYKDLESQGEQTLVRYIESSYYQTFILLGWWEFPIFGLQPPAIPSNDAKPS